MRFREREHLQLGAAPHHGGHVHETLEHGTARSLIMTKKSYEMLESKAAAGIATVERGEEGSLLAGSEPRRKGWVAPAMAAVLGVALLLGCLMATSARRGSDTAAATTPIQASTDSVPSCSLLSCTSSGCDWDSAPFLCLDGGSTGGCAAMASTWSGGDSCTSYCDLSGCADTLEEAGSGAAGAEDLPRRCLDCDDKQCSVLAEQWWQACGLAAPFVCLSGAASWGCADNELAWASAPATTCGECCDIGGC